MHVSQKDPLHRGTFDLMVPWVDQRTFVWGERIAVNEINNFGLSTTSGSHVTAIDASEITSLYS